MRLAITSQIGRTGTRLLLSGHVVRVNPEKGRDGTNQYPSGKSRTVPNSYWTCSDFRQPPTYTHTHTFHLGQLLSDRRSGQVVVITVTANPPTLGGSCARMAKLATPTSDWQPCEGSRL